MSVLDWGLRVGSAAWLCAAAWAAPACATENGASVYVLGSGGPGAAVLPPVQGLFLSNTVYYYEGKLGASKAFQLGGNVVAGVDAKVAADFATLLWVPTTTFGGGVTFGLGVVVPFGEPQADVSAVISGPRGRSLNLSTSNSAFVLGDPLILASLGWTRGKWSVEAADLLNIPAGDYRKGEMANLAFHRWANDFSLATTWHDPQAGWDVTGKAGLTFNGENNVTQYRTGTEFHAEASAEKIFSPTWSLGVQGFYFQQVTGNSGPGARLGEFKGSDTGIGLTGGYNFKIADKIPVSLRLHAITEFNVKNRLEGNSVFLDLTMPLYVKLPPGYAH